MHQSSWMSHPPSTVESPGAVVARTGRPRVHEALDRMEEALNAIEKPVTDDEARMLVTALEMTTACRRDQGQIVVSGYSITTICP